VSASEHDQAMAAYQVLHHYALLCLGMVLGKYGSSNCFNTKLLTRSFKVTLKTLKNIRRNLDTILEIQKFNPESKLMRQNFLKVSSDLQEMKKKNIEYFNQYLGFLDEL
jgi:prephenate dehydrogenase